MTTTVRPLHIGPLEHGTRLVTVHCPHCGSTHVHGWPAAIPDEPGIYRSHCRNLDQRAPYRITGETP